MLAAPFSGLSGAFCFATCGTIAASVCSSPSTIISGSNFAAKLFAIWVALATLSTSSCLALPRVEKLSSATRGGVPIKARCVWAVDIAISASCSAVGFGFTPQSANNIVFSPAIVGVFSRSKKQLLAVLMPGAVPTQWNAARSMSGVEAMLPATMPDA